MRLNITTQHKEGRLTFRSFSQIHRACILNTKKQLHYILCIKIASINGWITSVFNICWVITYNQDMLSNINFTYSSTKDFYLGVIYSCIDNFNKGRVKIFTIKLGNRVTPSFLLSLMKKCLSKSIRILTFIEYSNIFILSREWL